MWQWSSTQGCWIGNMNGSCDKTITDWVGGSRATGPTPPPAPAVDADVAVDFSADGHPMLGLGACSGGSGARLLYDYGEPYRTQMLDASFTPGAGASMQVLKLEIGGDALSTEGTEPSHMRTRDDGDLEDAAAYNRGWEWWLLTEAKKRNPDLVTMALSWGVPGWIGNQTVDSYWSDDNIEFHVRWVRGLWKHHGVQLDWLGIWNEVEIDDSLGMSGGWDWVLKLRAALDAEPDGVGKKVKLLADDTVGGTSAACSRMLKNATIRDALAGLGNHYDWETVNPGADCERLRTEYGKSLWVSEGAASAGLGLNHAAWNGNVSG